MEPDELTTLRTFGNVIDAQVAVDHLKSQGIEAMIKKDDRGGTTPHLQALHGVDVIIRRKDTKRAKQVLLAMNV